MLGYLLRRVIATIPVVLLISLLVFLLIHAAPGDPAELLLSEEASPQDIADARRRWGLDQPIYVQYLKFLANVLAGDLGMSFRYADPVITLIGERLPATIEQGIAAAAPGGTIVIVGVADRDARASFLPQEVFFKELTIRGTKGVTHGVDRAIRWLSRLDLEPLLTHTFPLAEVGEAMEYARSGRGVKVLVAPG